jgi:hypothetical protein
MGFDAPKKTIDSNIKRANGSGNYSSLTEGGIAYGITRPRNVARMVCIKY